MVDTGLVCTQDAGAEKRTGRVTERTVNEKVFDRYGFGRDKY